jgi:two-component sensor histidine kinase/CheY-like chemotaxis protein
MILHHRICTPVCFARPKCVHDVVGDMQGPSSDLITRRFDALLMASASIVWWTNAAGGFVEEQPYWQLYTGQKWEEYRGSRWISAVHPDDRDRIAADWANAVSTGAPYFTQGRIWSVKYKGYRAFQTHGIPIKGDDEQVVGWLGALTDIQDSIDVNLLLQRTQEDLANSLKALRDSEARLSFELGTLKAREQQIQMLMQEVNHRSQNLLGIVLAIARRTWEAARADFMDRFEARIHALSSSHNLLIQNKWQGADLEELANAQLAPFGDLIGARIFLRGAKMYVAPRAAQALAMALHELATNAAKYGALSGEHGRVDVTWHILVEGYEPLFLIEWAEHGGPPIRKCGSGFGSTVLSRMTEATIGGTAELEFRTEGLIWKLKCPLASVLESGRAMSAAPRPLPAPIPFPRGPRVLIVEDELLVALEIEQALLRGGFAIAGFAARAEAAIRIIEDHGCEAAVLDARLAEGTSLAITEVLAKRSTPFVVLTAYSREQLPVGLRAAPYLHKPLQPDALVECLRRLFGIPEENERSSEQAV